MSHIPDIPHIPSGMKTVAVSAFCLYSKQTTQNDNGYNANLPTHFENMLRGNVIDDIGIYILIHILENE